MDVLTSEDEEGDWVGGNGTFGYLSRIEVNPAAPEVPITALCFDPYEELLWCGNFSGRVASFYGGNAFEKYTAFVSSTSDVRAIEVTESLVMTLSEKHLKANTRQGLHVFQHSTPNMNNMCCMYRLSTAPTLLLGGEQQQMIQFDFEKQKELRVATIREKNVMVIRGNANFIFTSDTDGNVAMRSMTTLETLKLIPKAHGGPITDFDISGNKLITCGCSFRLNALHGDPYVKVYDLRTFQSQKPLALSFAPVFTRFLPSFYDSRVILISQIGQAQLTDVSDQGAGVPLIIESDGYALTSFNVSKTRQLIAFGDEFGHIHVYADRPSAVMNESSFETEFADPSLGPPQSFTIDDSQTSLATVPLPFSTDDTYLSDWPEDLCQPMFRQQKPTGPHAVVKNIQFVGYAPNPRAQTPFRYFNVVPYFLDFEPVKDGVVEVDEQLVVPQFYRKLRVKPSRIDTNLLLRFNKTNVVPLDCTPASMYVNQIAHILHEVPMLRNVFLNHSCDDEHCIVCQLGFLFRMLSDMKPSCTASCTNLMRSLLASGSPPLKGDPLPTTQSLFKYFIDCVDKELIGEEAKEIREVLETELIVSSRCIRCGEVRMGEEKKLALTLQYPPAAAHLTMCSLIEKALHFRGQCEGECVACSSKTRMEETRRVKRLPPVLLVDTNATSEKFAKFWEDQLKLSERRPRYRKPQQECSLISGGKGERVCRYGTECRNRPYCKYSHGSGDWEAECSTWLADTGGEWRHFAAQSFTARISNGIGILTEHSTDPEAETYALVAMIAGIADEDGAWNHTVTLLKEGNDEQLPWCVINDSLVTQVNSDEATHFDSKWKLPLALVYANKSRGAMNVSERRKPIPFSVFQTDSNLTGNEDIARERRGRDLPMEGHVVGIDAEFINISKDHSKKSVGRVSCVDSSCDHILIDDYVVTCEGDVVDDYLTQYSGIMEDDLNPFKSTKHLTTLKRVYMKILYLVERGVIFVGHALNNDFSVLNIHVPSNQMQDTVQLFHLPQQRMISLQFLAWHLLGEKIQEGVHDSVEDARIALKLYKKWLELRDNGTLETVVHSLYETGKACNWRNGNGHSPLKSSSPATDSETASVE